jgi:hypothetical protein
MNIRDKFFANQDVHYTTKLTDKKRCLLRALQQAKI